MKLMNSNEDVPKVFYVFVGQGNNLYSQINFHNYELSKNIISSGFQSIFSQQEIIKDFKEGNIIYAPFVPNKTTLNVPSSHAMSVVNGYNTEYILEYTRTYNYKTFPSRFSCIYAFGDYESCKKASEFYKWDLKKVKKFRLKKFDNILDSCVKVVKCNMEIVTRMWNCDISSFERDSIERISNCYWQGIGRVATERQNIESGLYVQTVSDVLYEYLIEGMLEEII